MTITIEKTLEIARIAEAAISPIGFHVALTGGVLFRGSSEKDIDFIIYAHNPGERASDEALEDALAKAGFTDRFITDTRYVNRIVWIYGFDGIRIDFFMS